jgi:hypothetical protein
MECAQRDGLPHADALAAMAARIATGKPVGGDSDGGTKVPRVPIAPRKPSPAGKVQATSLAGLIS